MGGTQNLSTPILKTVINVRQYGSQKPAHTVLDNRHITSEMNAPFTNSCRVGVGHWPLATPQTGLLQ
jgi:hypothetical protein